MMEPTAFREARDKWNEQSKIHKEQRTLKNDAVGWSMG